MSDFSLTLVLQIKTSKIINDMAKVKQKSEKITAFGGILFVVLLDLVYINMLVTLIYPIKFVPLCPKLHIAVRMCLSVLRFC